MNHLDPWTHLRSLAGNWRAQDGDRIHEEVWLAPAGECMQGTARDIHDGKVVFMEFFSVESYEGRLSLNLLLGSPIRGPKTPKHFALASANDEEIVFENPSNEFPQRIVYTIQERDFMIVNLSGSGREESIGFRRVLV